MPGDMIAVDQLGDGTIILKKIEERESLDLAQISKFGIMQPAQLAEIASQKS